jgi:methylamine dehydrogenase heavy chain
MPALVPQALVTLALAAGGLLPGLAAAQTPTLAAAATATPAATPAARPAARAAATRPAAPAPLPPETLTVGALEPAHPKRVYLSDIALPHIVDGKLHVVDVDTMHYRGLVATGYAGQATLSADRRSLYVATTYHTRLSRGERTDVVDVYDTATLAHREEILIPPKHAQALNYRGLIAVSSDDRWVFVQNATPAVSVSVVDLRSKSFVQEIDTPGCWTVQPVASRPNAFATLCGDGTFLTVTLSDDGKTATFARSARLFDLEADPLFVHAEADGDRLWVVSFRGVLHAVDLSGPVATASAWPMVRGERAKQGWRPGGYQVLALHRASGRLHVAMHRAGREGTHKNPADQIWTVDPRARRVLARGPASSAISIAVTQDTASRLVVIDGARNELVTLDPARGMRVVKRLPQVMETAVLMQTH